MEATQRVFSMISLDYNTNRIFRGKLSSGSFFLVERKKIHTYGTFVFYSFIFPFMNLHPLVVHFPIALLSFYTFLEFLTLFPFAKKWNLKTTKILLLIWGLLWANIALQTGELAADILNSKYLGHIIDRHQWIGQASVYPYAILLVMYLLREIGEHQRQRTYREKRSKYMDIALKRIQKLESWKVFVIFAVIGFILLSITGAIGGGIVYGPDADPLTKIMFEILQ